MEKHDIHTPEHCAQKQEGHTVRTGRNRKTLIAGCIAAILVIFTAAFWLFSNYIFVCGGFYPKGEDIDLRGKTVSVEQYQNAAAEYPQLHIYWDIPIGGQRYDCTSESIAVGDFTMEELPNFTLFDDLKAVDGSAASCYDALLALREAMPRTEVSWVVRIGADAFPSDAADVVIDVPTSYTQLSELLPFLPDLERVDLRSAELEDEDAAERLAEDFPNVEFLYYVTVCGQTLSNDVTEISLPGASAAQLAELGAAGDKFLAVETIDLGDNLYEADDIIALRQAFNGAAVLCRLNFYGVETASNAEELDLSGIEISDTSDVDKAVAAMAGLKKIIMSDCGIPDEEMDALNKKFDDVRVVWTVYVKGFGCRTDADNFCISRITSHYGDITNEMVEPLKYCTDMVTLDLGHMYFDDISFVENMPHLKYFIIGDTHTADLSPLQNCYELFYLEMFITRVKDLTPLLDKTSLKHLNISYVELDDYTQLFQMTWLERLWYVKSSLSLEEQQALRDALPNTEISFYSLDDSSVDRGWRFNYSYFEMRDNLGMSYHV